MIEIKIYKNFFKELKDDCKKQNITTTMLKSITMRIGGIAMMVIGIISAIFLNIFLFSAAIFVAGHDIAIIGNNIAHPVKSGVKHPIKSIENIFNTSIDYDTTRDRLRTQGTLVAHLFV